MLIAKRNSMSGKKLPYARRLAYLEGTGTQWIELGVFGNGHTSAEVDYQYTKYSSLNGSCYVFGSRVSYHSKAILLCSWSGYSAVNDKLYFNYGSQNPDKSINFSIDLDRHLVKVGSEGVFVDGIRRLNAFSYEDFKTPTTMKLFDAYVANIVQKSKGLVRIFDFKLNDEENNIHLIPVMSYEGNPEMFDEVSGTFAERHGDFLYDELDGGYKCIRSRFSRSYARSRASRARLWKEAA